MTEIKAIGGNNPTVYTLANGILSAVTKTTDFSVSVKNAISFDVDNTGNAVVLSKDDRGFVLKTVARTAGALEVAKPQLYTAILKYQVFLALQSIYRQTATFTLSTTLKRAFENDVFFRQQRYRL